MTTNRGMFASLLKYWRGKRGWSQLDLATNSQVSAKHISFLETGRSKPGEDMVLLLANTLDLSMRDQNDMLRAAGFEPLYEEPKLDALEDKGVARALEMMMRRHNPYPMVVMDRCYEILRLNRAAARIWSLVSPEREVTNAMLALFDPAQLRPYVVGWEAAAREMVARVHRDCIHNPQDSAPRELLEQMLSFPGVPESWRHPDLGRQSRAAFVLEFELAGSRFKFLTTVMSFSAPQNITLQELQIESYYPLDEPTQLACELLDEELPAS